MTIPISEDPRFGELIHDSARVEHLGGDCVWAEGPAWLPDRQALVWSDIPNDRIMRWTEAEGIAVEAVAVEYTNGRTLDLEGRQVVCSHGHRRIERVEPDGGITPLVSDYEGRRLNSPNDVVVKSDGTIWFSDPPYGILSDREGHKSEPDLPACYVFRFDPGNGDLTIITDIPIHPNGLAFSPDESILYVSDTYGAGESIGNHDIMAFDVIDGDHVENPRTFAVISPNVPDGFRVDRDGNVWTSAGDGVHVYDPRGVRLGRIPTPEVASNCAFGGPDGSDLFITATASLYRIPTKTIAAPRPR
jgi:gluconolactonase